MSWSRDGGDRGSPRRLGPGERVVIIDDLLATGGGGRSLRARGASGCCSGRMWFPHRAHIPERCGQAAQVRFRELGAFRRGRIARRRLRSQLLNASGRQCLEVTPMPLLPCLLALALPAGPLHWARARRPRGRSHLEATSRWWAPTSSTGQQSTGKHWFDYDGSDALTDHPLPWRGYSATASNGGCARSRRCDWRGSTSWRLVYWGLPGMDDSDHHNARQLAWSNIGARTLAELVEGNSSGARLSCLWACFTTQAPFRRTNMNAALT